MKSNSREGKGNKIKVHYGAADYYRFYKSRYIENNSELYDISDTMYRQILSEFNEGIRNLIIEENLDFKVPYQLGVIGLRKYKPVFKINNNGTVTNKLPVDFYATRKLWESNPDAEKKKILVRHTNRHTDGYIFTVHFFRKKAKFKNKMAYTISIKRDFKLLINEKAKEGTLEAYLL